MCALVTGVQTCALPISARASPVLHACALPHSPPDESRHSLRQRLRNPCPPPPFGRESDGAPDRQLCQLCPRKDRMSRKPVPAQSGDRSRLEVTFDKPQLLSVLFGQYDQNLVALENRPGVHITPTR